MNRTIYREASKEFRELSISTLGTRERPTWPIDPQELFELRELIARICAKYDCNKTWEAAEVSPMSHIDDNVILGDKTLIYPGSVILGPCIIGARTRIGPSAFVHENSWVGENAVIGHCCEVKKSVLLDGIKVFHYGFIGDSIVSYNANVGAGTIFAVKRLDGKKVKLKIPNVGEFISSKKYGAIVGPDVQFGVNSLVMPGSIIEPGTQIKPGTIYGVRKWNQRNTGKNM